MQKRPFVLVLGAVAIDRNVLFGELQPPTLGGAGTAVSLTLRRFGHDVVWLTSVAEADRSLLDPVREAGVRVVELPTRATMGFANVYPDRAQPTLRVQRVLAQPEPYRLDGIAPWLEAGPQLIVFGPLTPFELPPSLLHPCHAATAGPIYLDPQGYVRDIDRDGEVRRRAWTPLPAEARALFLVKADLEEGLAMLGEPASAAPPAAARVREELVRTAQRLRRRYALPVAVVTAGESGAGFSVARERANWWQPAYSIRGPECDPTCCGDVFLAGLIHAREAAGAGWQEAGALAAAAASLNAEHHGLYAPSREELAARLAMRASC